MNFLQCWLEQLWETMRINPIMKVQEDPNCIDDDQHATHSTTADPTFF